MVLKCGGRWGGPCFSLSRPGPDTEADWKISSRAPAEALGGTLALGGGWAGSTMISSRHGAVEMRMWASWARHIKKRWAVCKTTGLCSRFGSRFASQIVEMSSSSSSLLLPPSSALSKKVVKVICSSTLQGRRRERCSGDKAPAGNVLTETAV